MTVRDHKNAVLARLREDNLLKLATYDVEAKNANGTPVPLPYVVVYSDLGFWADERLDFSQIRADFTYTIHAVGITVDQAQLAAERVAKQLRNWKPTVPGRTCWPMRSVVSRPPTDDRDGTTTLFDVVEVFELSSTPK